MEMLAKCALPLSLVNRESFPTLINALSPNFVIKDRKYYSAVILPNLYDREFEKLRNEITNAQSVSLTTDIWSSKNNKQSLLAVTGNFHIEIDCTSIV